MVTRHTYKSWCIFIQGQFSFITNTEKVFPAFTRSHKLKSFEWHTFKHLWEIAVEFSESITIVCVLCCLGNQAQGQSSLGPHCISQVQFKKSLYHVGIWGTKVLAEHRRMKHQEEPSMATVTVLLWMPFTFTAFLQHTSMLHERKRKPM